MEKKYRIGNSDRERGIMGVSMGGYRRSALCIQVSGNVCRRQRQHAPPSSSISTNGDLPGTGSRELMEEIFGDPPDLDVSTKRTPSFTSQTRPSGLPSSA